MDTAAARLAPAAAFTGAELAHYSQLADARGGDGGGDAVTDYPAFYGR